MWYLVFGCTLGRVILGGRHGAGRVLGDGFVNIEIPSMEFLRE